MPMTPRQLIEALSDCGILGNEDATELSRGYESTDPSDTGNSAAGDPDSTATSALGEQTQSLARQLIETGKATRFQVRAILAGASKGLRIGDYIVIDRIGGGGMGSVYKARHRIMKRVVALKLLPRAATDNPRLVQRFYREVEAAAALTHPNIVTAYDAGEFKGIHYLVSEYVDGLDLSQLVKKHGPLPLASAVDYTVQAGRGLTFAHEHGVIHRDVKPGNLLLSRDGKIRVLDMGLARFTEGDQTISEASLTVTGRLMGTVEYMAPEHAANPKNADHRSDVYALGCTFYRLLTGQLPYKGETAVELIIAQREQPTPRLADAVPGVPDAVQQVFEKMLAKLPEDRYQTMAEAVDALASAARTTKLPAAAAPAFADFDHESDSQVDTRLDSKGGSSLLGELAAANSGVFDPPPASGNITPSPEPLPAWPEATTHPEASSGPSIAVMLVLLVVVFAAALGIVYVVSRPAPVDPNPDPPVVVTPPDPVDPEPTDPDPIDPDPVEPEPVDPVDPPLTEFEPLVPGQWRSIFDGERLGRWIPITRIDATDLADPVPGEVEIDGRQLVLNPGDPLTGVSWFGPMPTDEFEVTVETKIDDAEMLSVAFPVGTERAAIQLDAGNRKAGLYHVDGTDPRDNPMAAIFDGAVAGWHQLRIRVTAQHVQAWLNGQPIANQDRLESTFGAPDGYHPMHPLSMVASNGSASLRNIRIRTLEPENEPTDPTDPNKPEGPDKPPVEIVKVLNPSVDWHDMIPSIDPQRDARGGNAIWSKEDDALIADSSEPRDLPRSALLIPAQITGSYQMRFDIDVERGFGPLVVTLPVDGKRLHLVLDGPTGSGFMAKRADANAGNRPRGFAERTLPVGGPHAVLIRVSTNNNGRITAAAKVNGRSVPGWTGTLDELTELGRRGGERRGGHAADAITLRIAAREISITDLQINILPGGRAQLIPVAADDPANELIDLPRPDVDDTDAPTDGDRPRPPRDRDGTRPPRQP